MHKHLWLLGAIVSLGLVFGTQRVLAYQDAESHPRLETAAQQQSENITLVGQIGGPVTDIVVQDDYPHVFAYLAVGPRLVAMDVTNASSPVVIGQSEALPNKITAVALREQNNTLYVTAGHTLYVYAINVSANPLRITLTLQGTYEGPDGYTATDVALNGSYAYVTFATGGFLLVEPGWLVVIDISTPATPTWVAEDNDIYTPQVVAAAGNYVYVGGYGLTIYDVSTPASPLQRGSVGGSNDLNAFMDLAVVGNYAYVAHWAGAPFRVIDVSNPDNPQQVGSYNGGSIAASGGMAIAYPFAYISTATNGMRILNISSPGNPVEIGFYDSSSDPHGPHLTPTDVAVNGNTAYVIVQNQTLHTVDITDNTSPSGIAEYAFPLIYPKNVSISGGYAYVADYQSGLYILNIANPAHPWVTGEWQSDMDAFFVDVAVTGHYAYLLDDFGISVLDVSNPDFPSKVGGYRDPSGGFTYITVSGNYAYVMAEGRGMLVFDISTPASPVLVTSTPFKFNGRPYGLSRAIVNGATLYATSNFNLCVVNVGNPASPTLLNDHDIPGFARDVARASQDAVDYIYLAEEGDSSGTSGGMRVLQEFNLPEVGYFPMPNVWPNENVRTIRTAVESNSHEAYMLEEDTGDDSYTLRLANLYTLPNISQAGFYHLPGTAQDLAVYDGYAYVPAFGYGLSIFVHLPRVVWSIAPSGGTLTSPYDGTAYAFASGTFQNTTWITHTHLLNTDLPSFGNLEGIGHAYQVVTKDTVTGQPVEPGQAYDVTIQYSEEDRGAVIESTLALYYWNGSQWVREPTSSVDTTANTITASPTHFSTWAILGETRRIYLPLTVR